MGDIAEIEQVVDLYVAGMARGDATALGAALHPRAACIGHFDGGLEWSGLDEFVASCVDEAIPEGAPVPPHVVESISITGDTAMVRVVNVWAGLDFRDTLVLLRHEGRWQIVSKVFVHMV